MNVLVDMWRYSEATEHGTKIDGFDFLSKSKLTKNDREECYSFFSEEPDRLVLVFGGTKGKLKSWIKNFLAFPLKKDTLVNTKTGEPGIIHSGFYSIWEQSKKIVDELLEKNKGKEIFVTGMSQGGAIATICARHLAKNRGISKDNLRVVTFGAPASGTDEYATQVNELLGEHYRVVDGYDIVPTLPPEKLGFEHAGSFIWLKVAWWHRFFHRIRDHFWSSYTKGLMGKFKSSEENMVELRKVMSRVRI